ncbi:MAG: ABC transporter substrate-binding protein [Pseudonocardiales bacterium]
MPPLLTLDGPHNDLSRRRFLAVAVAAGLLTACGSDTSNPAVPDAGPWTFTDDRGIEVTRPSRPARIVTNDQAGAALASLGVRPVGIFSGGPTDQNPVLEGIDLTGIESVGEVYGEINVEKLAALAPDLVVVPYDPRQEGPPFGFVDGPVQGQVETIAPILAIDGIKDPADVIRRFAELAAALGADPQAPAPAAARKRFEDAGSALRAAVEAKPDLLAVALYASPTEGISFCRPATFPGLRQLQQLGLELVVPEGGAADINEDFANFFFDSVSLELADKYPADLILLDADTSPEDMAGVPTWAALPAVQAGQIVAFRRLGSWTYKQNAGEIETIAAAVRATNPNLV